MEQDFLPDIIEIIKITFNSVKNKLKGNFSGNSFEIFGYDFIIDKDFKTWLIEVNTNPCLEESCPMLCTYIPRMLDDAFKLTIDKIFDPQNLNLKSNPTKQYFPMKGYGNEENLWDKIEITEKNEGFSQNNDDQQHKDVDFNTNNYYNQNNNYDDIQNDNYDDKQKNNNIKQQQQNLQNQNCNINCKYSEISQNNLSNNDINQE